jgi:hypothetical protein
MRERDWSLVPDVGTSWAIGVFKRIGVGWESALSGVARSGAPEYGFWAPTWACVLAFTVRHMDAFRLEQRFQRVWESPEIQSALVSAWMLAKEADTDPVVAVVSLLMADSPDLYLR